MTDQINPSTSVLQKLRLWVLKIAILPCKVIWNQVVRYKNFECDCHGLHVI